ncbi:MAG TPA: tetratricopeptide repeat protein, partial [Ktedonobacteraceae bacterium]|nr:tetratricopeptide repeat protein [Ktedonobacteraceae bacterium]
REYALECLQEHGEAEDIRRAHALYFLTLAEEAASHASKGEQQRQWLRQLMEEQENLRAASGFLIEQQETALALQLNGALWWYWVNRGYFSEGRSWLAAALALPHTAQHTRVRARALCGAGDLAMRQGNYQAAIALLEESAAGYQQLEETRGLAEALLILGISLTYVQQFSKARAAIEQSIILSKAVDNHGLLGHAQDSLARLAWRQGDMETTRTLSEANLQMAPQFRDIRAQISPRKLLAIVALAQGDYTRAAELAQELLAISQEVGDRESEISALYTLGTVALRRSDTVQALALYKQCLARAHEIGGTRNISITLARLGEVAYVQGDNALAAEHYQEGLSHADTFEDKEVIGVALLGLMRIAKAEKHYWRAAHLLGAAEARINVGSDLDALARVTYERDAAALRTYLGEEAYIKARNEGSRMTPGQALTLREPSPEALTLSPIYPDELTEREVEVLRLVANGLTDAQVAERLIISPRTVQGHLRSIYSKIQVKSRGAATRYAIERNLL